MITDIEALVSQIEFQFEISIPRIRPNTSSFSLIEIIALKHQTPSIIQLHSSEVNSRIN